MPWKLDTFKISNDPPLEHKLIDVVVMHPNPPDKAASASTSGSNARPWIGPTPACR